MTENETSNQGESPLEDRHELERVRIEKLDTLRRMGVNPYPYAWDVSTQAATLLESFHDTETPESGERVSLAGRVMSLRPKGKVTFAHLDDGSGRIQFYARAEEVGEADYEVVKLLDIGDIVGVRGYLFRTRTGEVTLHVESIALLSKSIRPLPVVKEKVVGDQKIVYDKVEDKELRYRQRYVDLVVNPEVRAVFRTRAAIVAALRRSLDGRGFLEVETPVLQPIYGGASARPFMTHYNALDAKFYLRISNELYLKRLIVGGLNRVYEFSKDFRNEGLDRSHNPEFTLLEFYQAYADYNVMLDTVEALIGEVACSVLGEGTTKVEWCGREINLARPWRRAPMLELLAEATGEPEAFRGELDRERLAALCRKHEIQVEKGMGVGKLLDELFGELVEPNLIAPTFVIDYPLETSPLAKRHRSQPDLTERFELIVGGMELANAFSELNDPLDQRGRFESQMRLRDLGDDEAQVLDEDYLRAMEYGMPPTGGVGIGVDRLVMLLTGQSSIKDVILFPQMRPE
ncbi:lysine--tRNA ligase [bacterium]|nr:lysine--tRNA ligase [bacterium]